MKSVLDRNCSANPRGIGRRSFLLAGSAACVLRASKVEAKSSEPIVSPIAVEVNRLWLAASINGGKPLLFVIDTGAGFAYIRPEIAKALKLEIAGGQVLGGLGKNQVIGTMYLARNVVFGGTIGQPVVAFASYDFKRGLPPDAAGLLASGLFTTRDSDVDFDAGEWRVWPHGRADRTGFSRLESSIGAGTDASRFTPRLTVTATLDGVPYKCVLDTGSTWGLIILPNAARRSGAFSDDRPFSPQRTSGFGGAAAKMSRRVRASNFSLGPLSIDRPLVTVMDPVQELKINDHDAIIGLPFLSLLNLSTDVAHNRIWAMRNRRSVPVESYNRAGMWLEQGDDGHARVAGVGKGSPAEAAGIQLGDVVTDPPNLGAATRALANPTNGTVTFEVARGTEQRRVELKIGSWL